MMVNKWDVGVACIIKDVLRLIATPQRKRALGVTLQQAQQDFAASSQRLEVGKTQRLNGVVHTTVGVAPEGFTAPSRHLRRLTHELLGARFDGGHLRSRRMTTHSRRQLTLVDRRLLANQ
jgi:hypothetical protein